MDSPVSAPFATGMREHPPLTTRNKNQALKEFHFKTFVLISKDGNYQVFFPEAKRSVKSNGKDRDRNDMIFTAGRVAPTALAGPVNEKQCGRMSPLGGGMLPPRTDAKIS